MCILIQTGKDWKQMYTVLQCRRDIFFLSVALADWFQSLIELRVSTLVRDVGVLLFCNILPLCVLFVRQREMSCLLNFMLLADFAAERCVYMHMALLRHVVL